MALAIQESRTPSVKGRLLSTLIMAFALMLQPMYGVVAGQVARAVSPATLRVSTEAELRDKLATANPGDFIVLEADISISEPLVLSRPGVSIYGQGHTVSYSTSANTNGWNAKYVLHVYRTTGVHIRDIKLTGGDAGLLVNGSEVSLLSQTGKSVDVSDNEFGGIEVSQGGGVTEIPELMLYDGLNLVNTTETAAKPTVWTDEYVGTDWIKDLRSSSALSTLINPTRDTQRYYYLNPAMLPAPEIHSVRFSTWSSDYNGIVVDQYLKGFTDATSYRAIIHRANGSDVIRDGAVNTINHINSGGDVALTTPFNFAGSAAGSWFGAQNSSWTTATRPLGVTIEVVSATHGLVTFSTPVGQSLVEKNGEYKDLIPAPVRPVITSVTPSQGSFISGNAQRIDVNVADIDDVRTGNLQLNKVVTEGQSPANGAREVYTLQKDATGWYAMVDTTDLGGDGKYLFKVEAHGFDGVPHGYYGNNSAWQYPSFHFVVDNTKPTVVLRENQTVKSSGSYFNPGQTIRVQPQDANLGKVFVNGVEYPQYYGSGSFGINWIINQNPTQDTFVVVVEDKAGNRSDDYTVMIDRTAPTLKYINRTSAQITKNTELTFLVRFSEDIANIGTGNFELIGSATGTVSNVRKDTSYPNDSRYYVDVTGVSGNGDLKLKVKAGETKDAAGNALTGTTVGQWYTIDNVAPAATIVSPINGSAFKTVDNLAVELSAADAVGLRRFDVTIWPKDGRGNGAGISYSWGREVPADADATDYQATFTLPANLNLADGEYTLYFTATDLAGNSKNSDDVHFTVDKTNPTVSATMSNPALTVGDSATVTINANDATSGIDYVQYRILDGSKNNISGLSWVTIINDTATDVSAISGLAPGSYVLRARAFDNAGNKKSGADVAFTVSEVAVNDGDEDEEDIGGGNIDDGFNQGHLVDEDAPTRARTQTLTEQIFTDPIVAFGNQGVLGDQDEADTEPVADSDNSDNVLGEQDESGTPLTDTATFGMDAPKLLGMVWYWWVAILAAIVGGWLLIAAAIRRSREEEA